MPISGTLRQQDLQRFSEEFFPAVAKDL